jgi:hypothetical protein
MIVSCAIPAASPPTTGFIEPNFAIFDRAPRWRTGWGVHDAAADAFGLTDADRVELLSSGVQTSTKPRWLGS